MKKYIVLLFSFLLISNISFGQSGWVSKFLNNTSTIEKIIKRDSSNYIALCGYSKYFYKSFDAGNNWLCIQDYAFDSVYSFIDGQFLNSQTGWIVGLNSQYYDGAIFKTIDGGLNWIRQNTGFNNYYCLCLCFLNENTGWVGSSGGTTGELLKTTNGGINWTKQDFPGAYQIRSVKFIDNYNGWILGLLGLVARTTDGGLTWIQKPVNNIPCSNSQYSNLFAMSASESWVLLECVYNGINSHLFKTINGGDSWTLMHSYNDPVNVDGQSFWRINFVNSSTGILNGGFSFIQRTSDSGINWNSINVAPMIGASPIISNILIDNNQTLACGGFSGAGGYRPFNYILKSTNSGLNWDLKYYTYEYRFTKTLFIDNNLGFVLADSGKIYKTTNSGNNWNLTFNNNAYSLQDISFANHSTGCLVSGNNYYNSSSRIFRTTNSGDSWTEVYNSLNKSIHTVKFIDQQNGWAGCDSNRLFRTTNSGLNWSLITLVNPTFFNIGSISFINSTTGWILGHFYIGNPFGNGYETNAFWKTTDGGNNWVKIYDTVGACYNFYIQFLDNITGYKLSITPTRIQKTTNGGSNWYNVTQPNANYLYCIDFINQNTGWGGGGNNGGVIYKTTDAGLSWILQFNEYNKTVYSIGAIDADNAWFCGDYSSIYNTTNGGGQIIGVNPITNQIPKAFSLHQNYPNPFNPITKIKFDISKSSFAKIIIYDILGREVATLLNEELKPGTYSVDWDGSNYASGIYFYRLEANPSDHLERSDGYTETKKMVLMK